MPRKPRFTLPGIPQHVIQRGNNREPCFLVEQDYRRYLEDLESSAEKYRCRIHAYVLMTNHVHLLVTPMQERGIGEMMQALGRRYVYYINKDLPPHRHAVGGPLQGEPRGLGCLPARLHALHRAQPGAG